MTRPISLGYAVPRRDRVKASDWLVVPTGCEPLSNPSAVPHWHYATDLLVERTLSVKLDALRADSHLAAGDDVYGLITWISTSTGLQGSSERIRLVEGTNELNVSIPGIEVGGLLKLRSIITAGVRAAARNRDPLRPRRVGSTLWSEDLDILLEGDSSRFPTEALNFEANGLGPRNCAWRIEVDTTDLDAPALSALRVVLNTEHPAYHRITENADSPEAEITRQVIAYDVARQLVVAALSQDDMVASEYERGSIGGVLRSRLSDYFGHEGDEVVPLRQRWVASPSDIDAELQAFFSL